MSGAGVMVLSALALLVWTIWRLPRSISTVVADCAAGLAAALLVGAIILDSAR